MLLLSEWNVLPPPPIPPKDLSRLDSNAILALESVELSPILLDLSACFMEFFFFGPPMPPWT